MLKIRLQGTKNDIRWFICLLQRDKRLDIENVSTFFDNAGTERYKRVYAELYRKNGGSGKKPNGTTQNEVMQKEMKDSNYVGSGMIIRFGLVSMLDYYTERCVTC